MVSSAPPYPPPNVLNYLVKGVPKLSVSFSVAFLVPFSFFDEIIIALSNYDSFVFSPDSPSTPSFQEVNGPLSGTPALDRSTVFTKSFVF